MKKLLLILLCLPLLFSSCKKDNNSPQNNSNNNSSTNTYDWYFEIKVDGVSNKIEGSFNNSYIEIDKHIDGPNSAYVSLQGNGGISAVLSSKGENTYVSGENFTIELSNPNINLGANYFTLGESASTNESFIGVEAFSSIYNLTNGLFNYGFYLSPTDTNEPFVAPSEFPINITQLPQSISYNGVSYDVGSPIIGSGSATIYVLDSVVIPSVYSFTRPYNIEINFEVYAYH